MRTLFLNCQTGIAGDMTVATLMDLLHQKEPFIKKINQLYPAFAIEAKKLTRYEKAGTIMMMKIAGEEESNQDLKETKMTLKSQLRQEEVGKNPFAILAEFPISAKIKAQVKKIFSLLLTTQEAVHGQKMTQLHFTKLGSLDGLLDITSVCLLLEELKIEKVVITPINTGFGMVQYGDKIFNVPAPVTRKIVADLPHFHDERQGELCTPTGVALMHYFAKDFLSFEEYQEKRKSALQVGRGFGLREFSYPSYLEGFILDC